MTEELTPEQVEEFRSRLESTAEELEALLETSRSSSATVDLDQPFGRLSRMDAIQQQRMAQASRQRAKARFDQVRAALAAIQGGEYGLCRRCDDPIALARLDARPETPLCLECQREIERR